jgi:hypothetical protein
LRFFLPLILLCCWSGKFATPVSAAELRVLFIGNSLTFTNDIPAIVQALAESAGKQRLNFKTIAYPDFSLEDHWNQGDARKAIAEGKWDVVVLQQGPSALAESRKLLIDYARRFADEIRRAKAKPALYMVWPSRARFNDFNRVIESYAEAAQSVDGMLFPVGEAWQIAWAYQPELALYSPDNFHPSVAGSYLAAMVIYQQLYQDAQILAPPRLKLRSKSISKIELSIEEAALLHKAAREANIRRKQR